MYDWDWEMFEQIQEMPVDTSTKDEYRFKDVSYQKREKLNVEQSQGKSQCR